MAVEEQQRQQLSSSSFVAVRLGCSKGRGSCDGVSSSAAASGLSSS